MAKKSAVNRNERVKKLVKTYAAKRAALKATANDAKLAPEERFEARLKLAELPRNSSKTRIRNRCEVTGRPRAYYRKLKMSRISLRELGSAGLIPGLVKSSW
ncbi:30S ribosomal protein S14 [Phenylobacterium sp.]|uniref:30S ribosomal protein S14 n=1 Tax=Phenylobacterium sp. TaxID=1871053 RepID=UPI001A3C8ECB|nr:30S ribosomal protein S14 [Phenylobacterium sp.]MBL8553173.1 30S ribosomal protein S14 [Phenylobacterium sp.]MBX3482989.1 30S ribosomal protein S14 [Phenylobacterium sp.]